MIVDGRAISEKVAGELALRVQALGRVPSMGVAIVGADPVSARYVRIKERYAERIGAKLVRYQFPETITTEKLLAELEKVIPEHDGFIVQLPLPEQIDRHAILDAVPPEKDVDLLSTEAQRAYYEGTTKLLPPVTGAIAEVMIRHRVFFSGKRVAVVGQGRLVGAPTAHWFSKNGASVTVLIEGDEVAPVTKEADIIVLGTGVAGLLKPDMMKEGAVVLDGGTSEDNGELRGDADPVCADKASLFTPVPGGIGPITVSSLFKNLLALIDARSS